MGREEKKGREGEGGEWKVKGETKKEDNKILFIQRK